jgi:hypothetical protein
MPDPISIAAARKLARVSEDNTQVCFGEPV